MSNRFSRFQPFFFCIFFRTFHGWALFFLEPREKKFCGRIDILYVLDPASTQVKKAHKNPCLLFPEIFREQRAGMHICYDPHMITGQLKKQ